MEMRVRPARNVATRGNYTYRSRSAAQSSGEHIKTCRYETRHQSGCQMPTEKSRYSPEVAVPRSRRILKFSRNSTGSDCKNVALSLFVEKLDANALLADSDSSDPKKCRILDPNTSSATEIEIEKKNLHAVLLERCPIKAETNSLEYQLRKALRLYRYMSLPDIQSGYARPMYRPFLKRNLIYMKKSKFDSKYITDDILPPICPVFTREKRILSEGQKREHIHDIIAMIWRQKEENLNGLKRLSLISPKNTPQNNLKLLPTSRKELAFNGKSDLNKIANKQVEFSRSTPMIKFFDVRHKDMPGNRKALITVYLSTEIDGIFGEIVRLPSATVQMQINNRNVPVAIDLPRSIGCHLEHYMRERNDYVIIRVTFSGEDVRTPDGRTLRCVPSRKADKTDLKRTRYNSKISCARDNDGEDSVTMFGARCISSVTKHSAEDGVIYGNGSVILVSDSLLKLNGNWKRDTTLTKRLIELGKKLHMSPFVRMSIAQDTGADTSSSEDDDESKSCSSIVTSVASQAPQGYRSTNACYSKLLFNTNYFDEKQKNIRNLTTMEGPDQYMKSKHKFEMSLEFPKQICYRFIMKYNEEPDTVFPENHLPDVELSSCSTVMSISSAQNEELCEQQMKFVKNGRRHCSPLKEVSSAQIFNGHRQNNCYTSQPSCPIKQMDLTSRNFVSSQKQFNESIKVSVERNSIPLKSFSSARQFESPSNFRLVVPRRDLPLSTVIDQFATKYDKCSKIKPPKPIAADDKVTVPELHYAGFPEPDGNAMVTRFLSPPNKCFFCMGTFPDMFALLLHMRTSYPRLDIVYRGDARQTAVLNTSAPVYIDVFIRENFDCSFEGPMIRQYMSMRFRTSPSPQRCMPNDRITYLVYKAEARAIRGMKKDLSMFFTQSDREKRALKGNNAAFFGFRSRHPLMNCSQISTKQTDQEWLREYVIRQIEDFVDLSRLEKDFMILWNIFLLNLNHKPFGRCHVYRTCRLFIEKHRKDLIEKKLTMAWVSHLTTLHEKEALDSDEVYDLTLRLKENYDPTEDHRHVVYNTRLKLENMANNIKKEPPAWQKDPIHGPKVSILRSSSVARFSTAEQNPENEETLRKFLNEPFRNIRRSSSCSTEELARPVGGHRRQREPDCSKYLFSPRATKVPRWLSFAEDC